MGEEFLIDVTTQLSVFLYTFFLVFLLVFCAIYFTVRTRFVQIRYIKDMFTQLTEKRHAEIMEELAARKASKTQLISS